MSEPDNLPMPAAQARQDLARQIVGEDDAGRTMIVITDELSERFNVLSPSVVLRQTDPYFKPDFSVVKLSLDPAAGDYYVFDKAWGDRPEALALAKSGLTAIASAGGIDFSLDPGGSTYGDPEPVMLFGQKIMDTKTYKYQALGTLRKSDGIRLGVSAEKEWSPQRIALQIEMNIEKYRKESDTDAAVLAKAKTEFLRSMEYRSRMMAAKAHHAVIREIFPGLKQKYLKAEAAKPFLVVTFNYSPDTSDPQAARILASLVGADVEALYGSGSSAPALPVPESTPPAEGGSVPLVIDGDRVVEPGTGECISAPAAPAPAPAEEVEEAEIVDEGPLGATPTGPGTLDESEHSELLKLAEYVVPVGGVAGQSLRQIVFGDADKGIAADDKLIPATLAWADSPGRKVGEQMATPIAMMRRFADLLWRNGGELS